MKKTLVILLALMLVFAFSATALAADTQYVPYTDIADEDDATQTAIERLSVLGALKGYNAEGTIYAPDNLVTREEFATIGVRIAGLEDQVALYASLASAFTDVEEGRWSEGYINCANANGIMVGRGAGLFDPKANVTMQEVATVLLRAVGYTDQLPGAWPTDYNRKAVNVGLTEYVDYIGPKFATRGEVAALVNEAVDLWIVFYMDNEIGQGLGQLGWGWGEEDYFVDEDGFAYKIFKTNEGGDEMYSDLLEETFGAYVDTDFIFEDDEEDMSEGTAWYVDDFDDYELGVDFWYDGDEYSNDLASLYGISDASDLTDLGWQTADVTFNEDDEVVYIDITSTVERTAEADDDYAADTPGWSGDLLEDAYGEIWFDADGDYYAAKDFSYWDTENNWDVVTNVEDDEINCYWGWDFDLDDNYIFYLLGEGFITAADIQVNDVIYYADSWTDDAEFDLVVRPAEGTLDDYGTDFIEFDDVDYQDFYGYFSIDKGDYIDSYDTDTVFDVEFSDTIFMAPAYSFVSFVYFYDDLQLYQYAVLDSYVINDSSSKQYVWDPNNEDEATGMRVMLPGDTELTEIAFDEAVDEDYFTALLPREGSLIEYTLNGDGECIATLPDDGDPGIVPEQNILTGHDWYEDSGPEYLGEVFDIHSNATGAWTSKGRLALAGPAMDDTYTFADDAVIYLVATDEDGAYYEFDSVECLTYDDFKALGDFTAYVCLYDLDGREISVMYVKDIEEEADETYGFGLYTGEAARSISLDAYYMEIGGKVVLVSDDVFDDFADEVGLIAYKTSDGVIEDELLDVLLFNDDAMDTWTSINAYYNPGNAWYDELDMEIDQGSVYGLPTDDDITFDGLFYHFVLPDITLFFADMVESYDYDTDDAVDFEDVANNDYAVLVYDTATENDLLYLLLDTQI